MVGADFEKGQKLGGPKISDNMLSSDQDHERSSK